MEKEQIREALLYTGMLDGFILPVVYTLYDSKGAALYVGATQGLIDRLDWHKRKNYWGAVTTIGIRVYPDREQMRIAELAQIFTKKPIYNRDGQYTDEKEVLFYGIPGIKFSDLSEEVFFAPDEL